MPRATPWLGPFLALALVGGLSVAGVASAWTLDSGVRLVNGDATVETGAAIEVNGSLTFESDTGAPVVEGVVVDARPPSGGSVTWTLKMLHESDGVTLEGSPSDEVRMRVAGLDPREYEVTGRTDPLLIDGESGSMWDLNAGDQTVRVHPYNPTGTTTDSSATENTTSENSTVESTPTGGFVFIPEDTPRTQAKWGLSFLGVLGLVYRFLR